MKILRGEEAGALRIAVHGLGHVGSVNAAAFARAGHDVIATDRDPRRVADLAAGYAPVPEPGLARCIAEVRRSGRLAATPDAAEAVASTDLSLVCVGTPGHPDGSPDLRQVVEACSTIGRALARCRSRHVVVLRSTVPPGTTRGVVAPALERASGLRAGADFGVVFHPEFLREGRALADFDAPSRVLVGELDRRDGDALLRLLPAHLVRIAVRTEPESAELVKQVDNSWHALKVAFANEVGAIAQASGIDPHAALVLFARDTKLNLSSAYLVPGAPYGGGCLPKDLAALNAMARGHGVDTPLLAAVAASNHAHLERIAARVGAAQRIGIAGVGFKPGVADWRGSPAIALARLLEERGTQVRFHDPLAARVPDAEPWVAQRCLPTADALGQWAEVVVVMHADEATRAALARTAARQVEVAEAPRREPADALLEP